MLDNTIETIPADERRLKQILVNLLSNAIKFTPAGGKVGLNVQADAERQSLTFTVWDTGIGIGEEDQERLFKPFVQIDSQLNRQYEGTGLGLALVLRLAQAHSGGVALTSAPGQGSRFSVTLPWVPEQHADQAEPKPITATQASAIIERALLIEDSPSAIEQARTPSPRILLVEDNQATITMMQDYLHTKGYAMVIARNGGEALLRANESAPALILMDIQMPGMDGLEAIRRIRAHESLQAIPIIALTALAMPGDRERCLQAGADDYLAKPVNLRGLLATIQSHMHLTNGV